MDGNGTNDIQVRYRSFTTAGFQIQQSFCFSNTGQTAAVWPSVLTPSFTRISSLTEMQLRGPMFRPKCHLPDTFGYVH